MPEFPPTIVSSIRAIASIPRNKTVDGPDDDSSKTLYSRLIKSRRSKGWLYSQLWRIPRRIVCLEAYVPVPVDSWERRKERKTGGQRGEQREKRPDRRLASRQPGSERIQKEQHVLPTSPDFVNRRGCPCNFSPRSIEIILARESALSSPP